LIARVSENWLAVGQPGSFIVARDVASGLTYRFDLPQQLAVGGHTYQDDTIGWQSENIAHCFIKKDNNQLYVEGYGAGQLSLEPWELLPAWDRTRESELYRVFSDNQQTRQQTFAAGEAVIFPVRSGAKYVIKMGAARPVEPPPLPTVEPKPGEHVMVLANANESLPVALKYIRRFAPDFTFAPPTAAGRWAYVTVVATPAQVSDAVLDEIRGAGAIVVERVVGNTVAETKAQLDDMAARGRRFLSAVTPPEGEPPPPTPEPGEPPPPPAEPPQTYVVQPGDTLGRIAQKFYGRSALWPLIFEANRDKISDPGLIRVGMELLIPPKP
jgi:LysM repeat protein